MGFDRYPNKLKKYRRIAEMSQKKVAKALCISDKSLISRWEHGAALPGLHHAFKLSKLYNTLPHELFDLLWNQTGDSLLITNPPLNKEEMHL